MELTYGNVSAFMPPNLSATSSPPYSSAFTEVTRFLNRPAIKRVFYAAMKDLIDGPFQSAFLIPYMQKLDGIGMQSTNHGKAGGFIDQRRARLRQAVTPVTSSAIDFIITTGGGAPLTVDTPTVVLEGKAPIEIAAIATTVNGVEADPPFVIEFGKGNLLNWKAEGPLSLGQNRLEFIGTTLGGDLVDSAAITVTVVPAAPPAIDLVTPATATAGEVLLIIGRNFRAGLKVFLGETELPLVAVEIGEPSRVEAQMPVGLPEGPTPLTILNPSGLRSDPFTVRVVAEKRRFIRGDADRSGIFDLTDVIFTLNYLFRGGVAPTCLDAADADDNGVLNLTDGIVALSALFEGGAPLPAPYPAVGSDVTEDPLDCALGIE
jgi:hypothetical protein